MSTSLEISVVSLPVLRGRRIGNQEDGRHETGAHLHVDTFSVPRVSLPNRRAVFLPVSGDAGPYGQIEDARRNGGNAVTVTGDSYKWPTRPTFGVEQDPAPASGV